MGDQPQLPWDRPLKGLKAFVGLKKLRSTLQKLPTYLNCHERHQRTLPDKHLPVLWTGRDGALGSTNWD